MKRILLLLSLSLSGLASAQPCFTDWQYGATIQVANANASALTDHQVMITVNTQALILGGKMNANGSDLRFGTDCCTPLCYSIESGINTASTIIWVKVPSIPANGSTSFTMYYGNTSATTAEDPSCVFDLYDDFNNGQLNAFAANCGTNTISYNAGTVTDSWSSQGVILSNAVFPMTTVYTAEADVTAASGNWPGLYWLKTNTTQGYADLMGSSQFRISKSGSGTGDFCQGHNWASSLYSYSNILGTWSITWIATGNIVGSVPSVGTVTSTDTEHPRNSDMRLGFGGISSGAGSMTVNWVRVRKYAAITPTVSIGTEYNTTSTALNLTASSTNLCAGQPVTLDAGAGLAYYNWSTMETGQTITVTTGGWYSVIAGDSSGCISEDSLELIEFPAPNIDLGSDVTVCPGTSVDLDAGAGFTGYDWSSGGNAQLENVTAAGLYSVIVTDGNGCTNSDTIEVFNYPGANASFSVVPNYLAANFTDASTTTGSIVAWMWDFGDGNTSTQQNPTHTYATGGTYNVCLTVTTADGCTDTYCFDVFVSDVGLDELSAHYFETYPNPANSELIVVSSWNATLTYELISANGSLISTGELKNGKNTLQVGNLEPGIYMIRTAGLSLRFVKK